MSRSAALRNVLFNIWRRTPRVGRALIVALVALALGAVAAPRVARAFGDLRVTISVAPPVSSPAGTGGHVIQVKVKNISGVIIPAEAVVLEYRVPRGLIVTDIRSDIGPCEFGTQGDPSDPARCELGNFDAAEEHTIDITYSIDQATPAGTIFDHDFRAIQNGTEDNPPDNQAKAQTTITASANLVVRKFGPGGGQVGASLPTVQGVMVAGTVDSFTVEVINNGPSMARSVLIADRLPAGMRALDVEVVDLAGAVCEIAEVTSVPRIVSCEVGDVPAGETRIMVVRTLADANVANGTVLSNIGDATSGNFSTPQTPDPALPNAVTLATIIVARADLRIVKSSEPEIVYAGEIKRYHLRIENLGPSDAQAVQVSDVLPASARYQIDTGLCVQPQSEAGGATVTCSLGTLRPGQIVEFDILARIMANTLPDSIIENRATVTTTTVDLVTANNQALARNRVEAKPDLRIVKFGNPVGEVRAGSKLTYTIQMDNLGPSWAHKVVLTDTIHSGGIGPGPEGIFRILSVTSDRPTALCAFPAGDVVQSARIVCDLRAALEVLGAAQDTAGAGPTDGRWQVTVVLTARTVNGNAEPQDIVDTAVVSTGDFDPDTSNNLAQVMHDVTAVVDLAVEKVSVGQVQVNGQAGGTSQPTPDQVTAGLGIEYTVTVTNRGPSTAENVLLLDRLPAGLQVRTVRSVTPDGVQHDCTAGTPGDPDDVIHCGLGKMPPTSSAVVVIEAVVDPDIAPAFARLEPTRLHNDVVVVSDRFDPNDTNNYDRNTTAVNTWADMSIRKRSTGQNVVSYNNGLHQHVFQDIDNQVTAGLELRYEITVQNHGPSTARNVTVRDNLPTVPGPPGVHYAVDFLKADGVTCRPDAIDKLIVFCEVGDMKVGERRTFDLYVRVHAAVPNATILVNTATVLFAPSAPPGSIPPIPLSSPARALQADPPTAPLTNDPLATNNVSQVNTTVLAVADVGGPGGGPLDLPGEPTIRKVDIPAREDLDRPFEPDLALAGAEHRYLVTFGNAGPSVARSVALTDLLDFKQVFPAPGPAPIPGETFVRCEPFDPDDLVTCTYHAATNTVTIDQFLVQNEVILPGSLNPGEGHAFYLIVEVDPGYVLDADDLIATNRIDITSTTTDFHLQNNFDRHQSEITDEADLSIEKTDNMVRWRFAHFARDAAPSPLRVEVNGNPIWNGVDYSEVTEYVAFTPNKSVTFKIPGTTFSATIDDAKPASTHTLVLLDAPAGGLTFTVHDDNPAQPFRGQTRLKVAHVATHNSFTERYDVFDTELGRVVLANITWPEAEECIRMLGDRAARLQVRRAGTATVVLSIQDVFKAGNVYTVFLYDLPAAQGGGLGYKAVIDSTPTTNNLFLMCDPVAPGGMLTYTLTMRNLGPSDAADVYVVDWLPERFVVVDPDQITVTVSAGKIIEVRDDGRITVRLGRDNNNEGTSELGRLNREGFESIVIGVMVRLDAPCGQFAENRAIVETRRNDRDWPPAPDAPAPGVAGRPRTGTFDPFTENNNVVETTKIECPEIEVEKTVSFDGLCPGHPGPIRNVTAKPMTFCFEITNTGTTYLDDIRITDTLKTRTMLPLIVYTDTIKFGRDRKVPLAPGETITRSVTVENLLIKCNCGVNWNEVEVTANPTNSGRTDLPCLNDVRDEDEVILEVPCVGVDWRLQLPILGGEGCESWLQIQNVGDKDTMAMVVAWGEPGFCPPQAAGPLKIECTGLLRPGSAWSMLAPQVPSGANSAIVYSLSTDRVRSPSGAFLEFGRIVCNDLFFEMVGDDYEWAQFDSAYRERLAYKTLDFGAHPGEPIAVSVNRRCPDAVDPNVMDHAAYVGVSSDMAGQRDPIAGAYMYYAPLVFAGRGGLSSTIYVQNAGTLCSSLEIWYKAQDDCLRAVIGDVLTLSPGETVALDPATVIGPDWLGSAWVRSTQSLGIVVETRGANHFSSYVGVPADIYAYDYSFGDDVNFAPLTYSEYQGWDTAIQVQNLSATNAAKVKVYFIDRAGGIITTLVDWICPRGSQSFFLPVIGSLPGNWVGSARVESQEWITPGGPRVDPPRVSSVIVLEKWGDPARTARSEALAYNAHSDCLLCTWQIGAQEGGLMSGSAVFAVTLLSKGNRGIHSEFAVTNLVPKPGFTDFAIFIYDQNGLLDHVCEKLTEKQVEYIDIATWGIVNPGFLGSAVVSATYWEHDVFDSRGGFVRNLVGLGGTVVERVGARLGEPTLPGDESKGFEGIPIFNNFLHENVAGLPPVCPGAPTRR